MLSWINLGPNPESCRVSEQNQHISLVSLRVVALSTSPDQVLWLYSDNLRRNHHNKIQFYPCDAADGNRPHESVRYFILNTYWDISVPICVILSFNIRIKFRASVNGYKSIDFSGVRLIYTKYPKALFSQANKTQTHPGDIFWLLLLNIFVKYEFLRNISHHNF